MSKPGEKGLLIPLPKKRHSRTVATTADVHLPPVRWTPNLIDQVTHLLADMLVQDLRQRPPGEPIKSS